MMISAGRSRPLTARETSRTEADASDRAAPEIMQNMATEMQRKPRPDMQLGIALSHRLIDL
jgi:hypothetical protein